MPLFGPPLARNVALGKPLRLSSWRKVAIGTWRTAGDPSVYGMMEVDVSRALAYLEQLRARTGARLTITHLIGKVLAETLRRHPQINCILRFGRLYPRKNVDIFFQVASDTLGDDLSGMTVRNADRKSITEIAAEMQARVDSIRKQSDPSFKRMKSTMGALPGLLAAPILTLSGFFMYTLNLWTPLLGTPRDPFGSVMVTNIGSLGLESAFAPLVPYSRVPLLLALGAMKDQPVVRDGAVVIAPVLKICVTFDHRLVDGVHASQMAKTFQALLADPGQLG